MPDFAHEKQIKKDAFETFVRIAIIIIAAGSILAAIKCIFVGLQRDEEYALTLSYRLIKGDRLLAQIWDPHQTSAFLLSAIEWIFIKITGGTTFLVLWCKIAGSLIHGLLAFYLYRTILFYTSKRNAFLLAVIYFGILPKDGVIPEFSLMMAWFITLIVISLMRMNEYSKKGENKKIILQSVLLSLYSFGLVLSYPSCVILIPFIYAFLIIDRKKNPKAVLFVYPVVFVVLSALYAGYLLSYMSPEIILFNVKEALKANGSHEFGDSLRLTLFVRSALAFVIISTIAGGVSAAIVLTAKKISGKANAKTTTLLQTGMCAVILGTIAQVFFCAFRIFEYLYSYELCYYFWIIGMALFILIAKRKEGENVLFFKAVILNLLGFLSVMMLTNLTIFTSIPYCISGVVICLLAIMLRTGNKDTKTQRLALLMVLAVAFSTTFFKGFSYNSNDGYNWNVLRADKLVHAGPAKGIILEYMTGCINESAIDDWNQYIEDGDSVLVWDVTSLYYMNKDVNIASYTTISTPTYYVDSLKAYWSENPDKYPDVIAVADWFGNDFRMTDYDHFLDWIENEFGADVVCQSNYYRYYIRRR